MLNYSFNDRFTDSFFILDPISICTYLNRKTRFSIKILSKIDRMKISVDILKIIMKPRL